jgi:hypothetical protein
MTPLSPRAPVRRNNTFSALGASLLAIGLATGLPAQAEQQAHAHGRLALDVAIDARTITIAMEAPLDNFLGFERAPRTEAERRQVAELVARLKRADGLFVPDPAAACSLSAVTLDSEVLGLDSSAASGQAHAAHSKASDDHAGHADIDARFTFACTHADRARYLDVPLLAAFKRIRSIDVQVAALQGQFKRRLTRSAPRLTWGK